MKRQNIRFIEEFDPVRKRRMIIKSQSLSGKVPSSKNEKGIWFESAFESELIIGMPVIKSELFQSPSKFAIIVETQFICKS